MRKSKEHWVICMLAALETCMAGGSWPQDRVGSLAQSLELGFKQLLSMCPCCGGPIADSLHVFWNCPYVKHLDDPIIRLTNGLCDTAHDEAGTYPRY